MKYRILLFRLVREWEREREKKMYYFACEISRSHDERKNRIWLFESKLDHYEFFSRLQFLSDFKNKKKRERKNPSKIIIINKQTNSSRFFVVCSYCCCCCCSLQVSYTCYIRIYLDKVSLHIIRTWYTALHFFFVLYWFRVIITTTITTTTIFFRDWENSFKTYNNKEQETKQSKKKLVGLLPNRVCMLV